MSQLKIVSAKVQASIIFNNAFYFPGDNSSVHFGKQDQGKTIQRWQTGINMHEKLM